MRPSEVLSQHRDAIRQAAARYRVANPRELGSAWHGHDVEGRDLDLLVEPLPGTTLFDLGGLQDALLPRAHPTQIGYIPTHLGYLA